jgi:hypothetical protein
VSELLERIRRLVAAREVRISEHGFDELSADGIAVREAAQGLDSAVVVEEYPASGRGPAVLVLEFDQCGEPLHVVWGIPQGLESPAVLVTAYRPDPQQWNETFTERRK